MESSERREDTECYTTSATSSIRLQASSRLGGEGGSEFVVRCLSGMSDSRLRGGVPTPGFVGRWSSEMSDPRLPVGTGSSEAPARRSSGMSDPWLRGGTRTSGSVRGSSLPRMSNPRLRWGTCASRSVGRCSPGVSGLRLSRTSGSVVRCSSGVSDRRLREAHTPTVCGCSSEMDNPRLQETASSSEPVDSCTAGASALRLQEIETCQSRCPCANEENTCHSRRVATTSMVLGR